MPRVEHLTGRCDVVHVTDLPPPPTRLPLVMTVHDLDAVAPARPPRRTRAGACSERSWRRLDERADAVIAVSHATADALADHGVDGSLITVVPPRRHRAARAGPTPSCPTGRTCWPSAPSTSARASTRLVRAFAAAPTSTARGW